MTDAPMTIAEMREAAIAAVWRVEVRADHVGGRLSYRLGATGYSNPLDAAEEAIRAIPLPADDAEMVERVGAAALQILFHLRETKWAVGPIHDDEPELWAAIVKEAGAAAAAMRGEK